MSDPDDPDLNTLVVTNTYTLPNGSTSATDQMFPGDGIFAGSQFSIPYQKGNDNGGAVTVHIDASDPHGNKAKTYTFTFQLGPCSLVQNPG